MDGVSVVTTKTSNFGQLKSSYGSTEAQSGILAVQDTSLALSAVKKVREQDGMAWYLQSGMTISRAAVGSRLLPDADSESEQPQLLAGTQTLKRSSFKHGERSPKRLKDIVQGMHGTEGQTKTKKGKGKGKKPEGWIWMDNIMHGQSLSAEKQAAYKKESEWQSVSECSGSAPIAAEAEMYRWLEQYEHKHAELLRVIARYRRDSEVWAGLAEREEAALAEHVEAGLVKHEETVKANGASTYARMQAAMHQRLEHNAQVIFKSSDSGAL
ncbi:hypothetical protein C8F01DRAFT_1258576 [Mycena amicta]|nr:hypothetical protein C8F01DRAFT_1258576 [Mycena amicta]